MKGMSALGVLVAVAAAWGPPLDPSPEQVKRGRYLAEQVAMCVHCHTPHDEKGALIRTRLFQGAPILVRSPFPGQPWASRAPHLAGLPGWTDEDAVHLLMTGRRLPRPPMPPYRLSREDAEAVVAYLRSLRGVLAE